MQSTAHTQLPSCRAAQLSHTHPYTHKHTYPYTLKNTHTSCPIPRSPFRGVFFPFCVRLSLILLPTPVGQSFSHSVSSFFPFFYLNTFPNFCVGTGRRLALIWIDERVYLRLYPLACTPYQCTNFRFDKTSSPLVRPCKCNTDPDPDTHTLTHTTKGIICFYDFELWKVDVMCLLDIESQWILQTVLNTLRIK